MGTFSNPCNRSKVSQMEEVPPDGYLLLLFFFFSSLSRLPTIVGRDFPRNQYVAVGACGMPDLLNNVLPRFAVASCGLCLCGAKSVGLQDVDLFCPDFLGRSALDPPVSKMLSAKQSVRQAPHFHSAAFPVGFACRWSAALGIVCGWFHLISDPATRPQGTDGRNGITESHNISQYCTCGVTQESRSLGSPV